MGPNQKALQHLRKVLADGDADLHLHTCYSDGLDDPQALIERVDAAGLHTFAITDHDTLAAILPAREILAHRQEKGQRPLDFIAGVELSVEDDEELHLLGYFPCGGEKQLQPFLQKQRKRRKIRNDRLLQRLSELGYPIDSKVLSAAGEEATGRMQVARALVQSGRVQDITAAFDQLLAAGRPAYVQREHPSAKEAIGQILAAGGVPVLAHPALYGWCPGQNLVDERLLTRLARLKNWGLLGVEAYHGEASADQQREIEAAAAATSLLATVGSDDHGGNRSLLYHSGQGFSENNTILVVAALLAGPKKQGKETYYLARRCGGAIHAGFWELPGGKVKAEESLAAALQRELWEELEVDAEIGRVRKALTYRYPEKRVILICLDALADGPFQLQVHDRDGYFTAAEALRLNLLPADITLFEALASPFKPEKRTARRRS